MSVDNQFVSDQDIKMQLLSEFESKKIKDNDFPTEIIELPSKGWYYSQNSPLSKGTIEMRYMTAKDEDILTSKNLRKQKVVLERLVQTLIVTPGVYVKDILAIDFFALMLASRVLGYGKDYSIEVTDPDIETFKQTITIDLTSLPEIEHNFLEENRYINEFSFLLPTSKKTVKWKFLTYKEDLELTNRTSNSSTVNKSQVETSMTDMLKSQIVEIDGERNPERISKIVDKMLALDSKALRTHIQKSKPGINTEINYISDITGEEVTVDLPLTTEFFWPTT